MASPFCRAIHPDTNTKCMVRGFLLFKLKQLCPEYGITLTITEEAYSSKASFLDCDSLPKYGEKPEGWNLVVEE